MGRAKVTILKAAKGETLAGKEGKPQPKAKAKGKASKNRAKAESAVPKTAAAEDDPDGLRKQLAALGVSLPEDVEDDLPADAA